MSSFTDYLEDRVLNHIFRNTASTAPATVYLALFTVTPSDTGGGTEVSTGGYARQAITFGASSGGAIANTSAVAFTAAGANYGTVVAVAVMDALTVGNMLAWDGITSAIVNDGDTINFPIGDIDITLT